MKQCSNNGKCLHPDGPVLSLTEFNKRKDTKDGLRNTCKVCKQAVNNQYYLKNKDKYIQYNKDWVSKNPNKVKINTKKFRAIHKDKLLTYRKANKELKRVYDNEYRKINKDRLKEYSKLYVKNNRDKLNAIARNYQIKKMNALPIWASLGAIKEMYTDCVSINIAAKLAGCTEKFVVDHIIPLQGKNVSGLHIHTNLQIITATENLKKSNKYEPIEGVV